MSDKEIMLVEYIGKKPKKVDNVLKSGAIWNGHGDIVELPVSIGRKLTTQYPEIWSECTDKTAVASSSTSDISDIDNVIEMLSGLDDAKAVRKYLKDNYNLTFGGNPKVNTMLQRAKEHLATLADNGELPKFDNEDDLQEDTEGDTKYNGVVVTEQLQPLLALAQAGNFSNDPEEAVSQAIDMLGGIDSGFYDDKTGMPQTDAIQLLVGAEAGTADRIDIAMANKTDK